LKKLILFAAIIFFVTGCAKHFPLNEDISKSSFTLIDQNGNPFRFPDELKNKISVVGFIYTNCPDICPINTHNLKLIQDKVKTENIPDVQFLSISFDTYTDSTNVLKEYAEIRNLDLSNWKFLTGNKSTIDSLIKEVGVIAIPNDTTIINGKPTVFFTHTDRISLIDKDLRIRKNYVGSKINQDEIIEDIKQL